MSLPRELRTFGALLVIVPVALFILSRSWRQPTTEMIDYMLVSIWVTACFSAVMVGLSAVYDRRRDPTVGSPLWHYVALGIAGTIAGGELAVHGVQFLWGHSAVSMRPQVYPAGIVVMGIAHLVAIGQDQARLSLEVARLQLVEAELALMRARLRPHFLFNSLNTVSSLIHLNPDEAEETVDDLAVLLRFVLRATDHREGTLREELEAVRAYLGIQKRRFEERLIGSFDVDEERLGGLVVPTLLLQPLVENAVLHGVASSDRPVRIDVRIVRDDDVLMMSVSDDGPGVSSHQGAGTTIRDLRHRLSLLRPPGQVQTNASDAGFSVVLRLPLTKETR